jgi:hypothetical protein
MAAVIIGVDPHQGSHTAVAVGGDEAPLGQVRVRACDGQAEKLLDWARAWPQRTWAAEGAAAWGTCWPGSSSRPGRRSWTCSPGSARGCGC